jgi:hypothetical protein
MTATVFVWDMFRRGPGPKHEIGVGHAAMHVSGNHGSIYISFWPNEHSLKGGWSSPGRIHFMNADRKADGSPQWASKSITDLDDAAIISWWSKIQSDPIIDYKHKKEFQTSNNENTNFQMATDQQYSILFNQCSTMVVAAILHGADNKIRAKIRAWLNAHSGRGLGYIQIPTLLPWQIPTITPKDVKNLVISIWNDF